MTTQTGWTCLVVLHFISSSVFCCFCFMCGVVDAAGLEFQDVTIFAVTDVHSWLAGGDKESNSSLTLDGNFGDLVSFVERARKAASNVGKDIFLVDNGDVIDGTGLSNIAADHCKYVLPLLQQVPFDALNCGNHELYNKTTLTEFKSSGFISSWNGSYLTSNIVNASSGKPVGSTSTLLVGQHSGIRLLTMGFIYEMGLDEGRSPAYSIGKWNIFKCATKCSMS